MNDIVTLSYDVILERLGKKYSYEISLRKYYDMIKCRRNKEEHFLEASKKEEEIKGMINLHNEDIKNNKINVICNVPNQEVQYRRSQEKHADQKKDVDGINEKQNDFDEVILSLYTDLVDLMNYNNFFIKDCIVTFIFVDKDVYKGKLDLYFGRIEEENKNSFNNMGNEYLNDYDDNKEKDNMIEKRNDNNIYDDINEYIFFEHYEIYGNKINNIKDILRNTFECLFFGMVEQYNIILKINYCHRIKEIYNYILFNEEIYKTLEHADYIEIDINKIHFDIIDYSFIFSKNLKKFVNYLKYVKDIHSCSYFISLLIRNIAYTNKIYKYTAQLFIYNNTNNECGTIFLRFVVNNKKEIFEKIGILKRKFTSGNILDIDISIYDHIKNIFINKYNMSFPEERIILSYVKYYYVYRLVNMKKNCDYNTNYSYIFSTNKESNISNTTHITCSSNSYETSDVNCQGPLYIKRKQLQKNIRKYIKCKGKNKLNTVKDKTKLSATQEIYDDDDDLNELYKINNNQNNFKSPSDCYLVRNEYNHKTRQYKNKIIYDHDNVYYSNKCVSQDDYNYYNDTYDDDEKDGNVHNKDVHKDVHNNIHNDVHNNIHNDVHNNIHNDPNTYDRKQNYKTLRNNKRRNNNRSTKYKKCDDNFNKEESIKKINRKNKEYNYNINKYNSDSTYKNKCITSIIYDEKENQKKERKKYTHNSRVTILNNKNCSSRQIVTRSMKYKMDCSIETNIDSKSSLNYLDILDEKFHIKENIIIENLILDDVLEKMLTQRINVQNDNIVTLKNRKIKPLNKNVDVKDNYVNFYSDDNEFEEEINKCIWVNEHTLKRNKRKKKKKRQKKIHKHIHKHIQSELDNINNYMINKYNNDIYQDIISCDQGSEHGEDTCNNIERFYNDNVKMKNTYNYKKRPYNYATDISNNNVMMNKRRKICSIQNDENFALKTNYADDKKIEKPLFSESLPCDKNEGNKMKNLFYSEFLFDYNPWNDNDVNKNLRDVFYEKQFCKIMNENFEEDNKEEDNKEENYKEENYKKENYKKEDNKEEFNKEEFNKEEYKDDQFDEDPFIKDQFVEEEHIEYHDNNIIIKKLIEVYNVENDSVAMYILNNEDESKKNPKHHQHIFNNDEKKESKSIDLFNKENDKEENNKNSLNNKEYKEDIKNKTYKSIKNINMKYSTNVLKKYPNDILKKGMMNKNVIKEKMNNEKYKDNKINNNQNKNKKQCKNYFIDTCNNNKQNNNSVEIINMNNIPHSKFMYNNYENDLITESVYNEIMKNLSRNMYFLNDEDNILTCVYNYKHILKNILYLENVIEKYNIHMSVIHVSNLQNVKSNQENNNLLNENHPNKISDGNYNKNNQKDNHMEKLKQIIHHIKNKCREYKNTLYKCKRYMSCKYIYGKQNCGLSINNIIFKDKKNELYKMLIFINEKKKI
ncbi:hypothetical protein PFNF54_04348 [Plasmodium falciparum NF54]|uniref:Uncharacterized protein n=1 Tax=Plasmodium falciparum (isolate NF54) TaxID=5843 RepID=W7K0E5_PLAFO|nr:hypothetical protein PFNF54_04348 [Plasmodium falciparum NF54]